MRKFLKVFAMIMAVVIILGTVTELAYAHRKVKKDYTPPVITINGSKYVTIEEGTPYVDAGATAVDNVDGIVPVRTSSNVNVNIVGVYTVKYTASDYSGNTAYAYRKVEVTAKPIIEPPIVEPPIVEPPIVEPPIVEPPIVEPPIVEPPVTETILLSSFPNISGSLQEFTGSVSGGGNVLTLSTATHDFKVGHGIAIKGAGGNGETNYWLITTVKMVEGSKITLSVNASTSVSGVPVLHDDTQAVNTAIVKDNVTYGFDIPQMNIKGLKLKSNTIYDGMGKSTLNLSKVYSSVPYVQYMVLVENQTNVTFKNFTVDGGKTRGVYANDQVGVSLILVTDASGVKIQNNNLQNNGYISVNLQSKVSNILIENNTILNTDIGIMAMPKWLGSLYLENAIFQNNYMDGGTSEGISIVSGMRENAGYANSITIQKNIIKNKSANGIQYGSRTTNIVISENEVTKCNNGICSIDFNLEGLARFTSDNITISGNNVHDNTYQNFVLDGVGIKVQNNQISNGNAVMNIGRYHPDTVIAVYGNTFTNCSTTSSPALLIWGANGAIIQNNKWVKGAETNYNVAIGTQTTNISGLSFSGNDLGGMRVLDVYQPSTIELLSQKYQ